MTDNTKYLGIDYGDKRVGIAVSDESKTFAFSRDYLKNDDLFFNKLLDTIKTDNISKIIVGYPINLNSTKSQQTLKVEDFKKSLESFLKQHILQVEVCFIDERLTSSLAKHNLISSGLKKKKRQEKGLLDSMSAQIILQNYLDSQSSGHSFDKNSGISDIR